MKKYILICVTLFIATFAYSQSDKEEIDLMQAAFGMDKKAVVADFVNPSPAEKDAFWKLYDEYETARKTYGQQRIKLFDTYLANYNKLTNETADSWTKEVITLQKNTDKLLLTYYNKIKKATNPVVALQFYQVEGYILSGIRLSILEELPLPELK